MNGLEQQVVEVGIGKKEFQNMKAFYAQDMHL